MVVDYHTHTKLCKHAEGGAEAYVVRAIELGLDELGCTDHAPLPGDFDLRHRMTLVEYDSLYAPEVTGLIEKYRGRIRIRRGIECDFLDRAVAWTSEFISKNEFDFVLGSVHFVGPEEEEMPLFGREYESRELEKLYENYYLAIARSAKAGLFDVIAHCDLVKKFGPFSSPRVDELIRSALDEIKNAGLCIEINTSGLRRSEKEAYPGERILALARELRIPLTLGSDAHRPSDVGYRFDAAVDLLQEYGGGMVSIFTRRQRTQSRVTKLNRSNG